MTEPGAAPVKLDFHFDVMCPWAYQTSKWIRDVRDQIGLDITWRFFSLEEVNRAEGRKHPWERDWSYGWSMMRVGAWLRRESNSLLDDWYEVSGRALHEDGRQPHRREVAEELVAEMGLDPALVGEAVADPTTHDDVKADHDRVLALGGFGVPTLVFEDGSTLFGPVVTPAPSGAEALRLWDLTVGWTAIPHLYELRRPKTTADLDHIAHSFEPYLRAREWNTVQKPVA